MKHLFHYLILTCAISCLFACRPSLHQAMPDTTTAERLLNSNPDSLAHLLEEQINPSLLCDSDKAYYWLLLTQAHKRTWRSLVNDSMIHFSVQYYKEKQSPRWITACMMAAEQSNYSGHQINKQIEGYLETIKASEALSDSTLWNALHEVLTSLYVRDKEAAKGVQTIQKIIPRLSSDNDKISAWFMLGITYSTTNSDSAVYYLQQAVRLARETKSSGEYHVTRNLADYLISINKNQEALRLLDELEQRQPSCDRTPLHICRVSALLNQRNTDAARPYLDSLEQQCAIHEKSDAFVTSRYAIMLAHLIYDVQKGKPINFARLGQFNDSISGERRLSIIVEKEQTFAKNKLMKDKMKLQIEKEELQQTYMAVLIGVFVIIAALIFTYQRRLLLKERSMQEIREQIRSHLIRLRENESIISKNEEQIRNITGQLQQNSDLQEQVSFQQSEIAEITHANTELQQQNNELQQEINQYAHALIQKDKSTEIYEQLMERCARLAEREKQLSAQLTDLVDVLKELKTGTYTHLSDVNWLQVYSSLNQIFDNYTQRLQNDYPALTEEDIQCCCLIKLRMTTSAIAGIYSISPASATKRKQRIRERINQSKKEPLDKNQSIDVYLWEY